MTDGNWEDDVIKQKEENTQEYPDIPKFKLDDGESKTIVFKDEGKKVNTAYGESYVFNITIKNKDYVWFVKPTWFTIIQPIADKKKSNDGTLKEIKATVTRKGTTQQDTRRTIVFE